MFFTRLAIAALSLGSFAKVFAAPIVPNLDIAKVDIGQLDRRVELAFSEATAKAFTTLGDVKNEVASLVAKPDGAVQPELVKAMSQVASALNSVFNAVKATGTEGFTNLATDSVATDMNRVLTSTNEILTSVEGLKHLQVVRAELESIKTELGSIQFALANACPKVLAIVSPLLSTVLALVSSLLASILEVVTGLVGGVTSGL